MNTLPERLWSRIDKTPDGCWEFTGCRTPKGYGQLNRGARGQGLIPAHRAAWEITNGPIPKGMFVCHRCDNPPCCNPDHLFLGTPADNSSDMTAKGRSTRGERNPTAILNEPIVAEIKLLLSQGRSAASLGRQFGVSRGAIDHIKRGVNWKHVQPLVGELR